MCKYWTVIALGAALSLSGFAQDRDDARSRAADPDMQRAIQYQRAKDRADARQERRERVRPSVSNTNADRRVEEPNQVSDPGERQVKKHKNIQ